MNDKEGSEKRDFENSDHDVNSADDSRKTHSSRKNELLDVYIGAVETGPNAAKRFNDLIAKTLKLQQ